jgi:AraC-like DNA-binding protein
LKCPGRSVISDRKVGKFRVVSAVYEPGTIDPPHDHQFASLSIVLSGDVLEVCQGVPNRQGKGVCPSQRSGASHSLFFHKRTEVISFTAPSEDLLTISSMENRFSEDDPRLLEAFRLRQRKTRHSNSSVGMTPSWLRITLDSFPWVSTVPLREACRSSGVHPSHFSRVFHQRIGIAPRAFRRRAKLRAASRWLLFSAAPPSIVALECGFSDQSHLTSAFTATFGVAPVRFRQIFTQSS